MCSPKRDLDANLFVKAQLQRSIFASARLLWCEFDVSLRRPLIPHSFPTEVVLRRVRGPGRTSKMG
jgi:hypothetical protein